MSIFDVDKQLAAAREIADQRDVPTRVLAVEMIRAAAEAITGAEGGISREALMREIRMLLPNIADADLREEPERATAAFLARALFAQAREMKLDPMAIAKEVVVASYAELDDGDKELLRQIASIMFPAFCAKVRRLYELRAGTRDCEKGLDAWL
jgi:hypothetical protein